MAMGFRLPVRFPFWGSARSFEFQEPGPLIDGDLELIAPTSQWVEPLLDAISHPLTVERAPGLSEVTRRQVLDFLHFFPRGHQARDDSTGSVCTHHFWMHSASHPQYPIVGAIALRIDNSFDTVMYFGHVGYHVYPHARGNHFAQRATRLLMPLAARYAVDPVWITCNPDNEASVRTCKKLGARFVEEVPVPPEHSLYQRGELRKCRYRLDLR